MTARRPTLVFGDDGSLGADRAWLWITQQHWADWHLDILSCHLPPFGPPIDDDRAPCRTRGRRPTPAPPAARRASPHKSTSSPRATPASC